MTSVTLKTIAILVGVSVSDSDAEDADHGDPSEMPITEEPKIEEPKIEEPKIEEPKIEEPKVENPRSHLSSGASSGACPGAGGDEPWCREL